MIRCAFLVVAILATASPASAAQTAATASLVNANTAAEADIAKLPNMTAATAKALVSRRPFASMSALDAFLGEQRLTREQRTQLYARLFVPVKLNTATDADILLIPGVGNRLLHEFKEYRPYKAME
jgi:DNA uptake protein ComE-like DNA-binding protein